MTATELLCSECGDRTVMSRCVGCRQRSQSCTCRPAPSEPVWLRNSRERRNGLARDLTAA